MQQCEQCGKNPANVHVTRISPAGTVVAHLCEECAKTQGIEIKVGTEAETATSTEAAPAAREVTCARCGMTYTAFREQGRLGCAGCYDTFSTDIDKMLKEMHGSCEHRGKRYSRVAGVVRGTADDLARLRGELDRAIGSENFEEAARLRDTISALVSQES